MSLFADLLIIYWLYSRADELFLLNAMIAGFAVWETQRTFNTSSKKVFVWQNSDILLKNPARFYL